MTLSSGSSRRGRVRQILQLRRAYDAADVDGDNALTLDEMEMFLLGLSPGASLEPAGVQHVWRCFNPQGKPSLNWQDFLHGMAAVRADPAQVSTLLKLIGGKAGAKAGSKAQPVPPPAAEEAPKATSAKKKRRMETAVDDEPEEEPAPAPKAAKASKTVAAAAAAGEGAPKKKKVLKVKAGAKGK